VKQQSDKLKADMDELRTEFDKCEKELNTCKSKMGELITLDSRLLKNELMAQQSSMKQRQEEWMQREASTLAEIDRLKKELELARRETDAVTDLSGTLDLEVSTIEADLAGKKKKQMERLINAMKEANLQSLSIQPPEELIDGGAHHRSGSTRPRRMIGSPRQLENAAPTSKNPHGVWV
jgi:Ras association domain-containing protein 7/8